VNQPHSWHPPNFALLQNFAQSAVSSPSAGDASGHVGSVLKVIQSLFVKKKPAMRSGIECLKRNRKNSHQQPLPGSLGKTGRAKAGVNIPLNQ
jgi:hypothetical protein